jgi:hypothetical protein
MQKAFFSPLMFVRLFTCLEHQDLNDTLHTWVFGIEKLIKISLKNYSRLLDIVLNVCGN